jgi:predicted O-methyltransferase YrrM
MSNSPVLLFPLKRRLRRLYRSFRRSIRPAVDVLRGGRSSSLYDELAAMPLLSAERTYNTSHPDYEPELVRNFPDRIQNLDRRCSNPLFLEIRKLARRHKVPARAWQQVYRDVMEEASTVPGFEQVMERKAYIENYLADLGQRYQAHYIAGWVNLVDAQFLYWAVRRMKPKTIVQTGVSNGLSSAFMMLALAKNGPDGRLHSIDIPAIFNPDDPTWTQKGKIYGVAIPQGKSSGWIVPDIHRDRFDVEIGDAKILLPRLVDRLDSIDMFFHDSDHTYNHMMFEFEQAMRKLAPDGIIIADDISWNASLWDFADNYRLVGYNYRGSMGATFLPGRTKGL